MSKYLLVPLTPDDYDIAGHKIDKVGKIDCPLFQIDSNILTGIIGISRSDFELPFDTNKFAAVKDVVGSIKLDNNDGYVKFKSGYVLAVGSLKDCEEAIDQAIAGRKK